MAGERLRAEAVEGGEGADAVRAGVVGGAGRTGADGGDHEVFRGVLGGDEFEDLGAVAGPFEELGAEGIGREFGVAFLENPVAQGIGEDRRGGELRTEFFLAAGGDNEEASAGGVAAREGIVGRGVAGVEGDQHIERRGERGRGYGGRSRLGRGGGDGAGAEGEAGGEAVVGGDAVAERDEIGAGFKAGDTGAVAEERGESEGEVAFAGAGVFDAERRRGGGSRRAGRRRIGEGLGEEGTKEGGEILDLAKFVGHALARMAAVVGDAEGAQPGRVGGDQVGFGAVVRGADGRGCAGDGGELESRGAVGLRFQLGVLGGREEVGVEEVGADESLELREGVGGREVFDDVARGVAPEEGEVRAGFERDGADVEVVDGGVGAAVFAEGEFGERAVGEGGSEEGEEAFAGGQWRHRRNGGPREAGLARRKRGGGDGSDEEERGAGRGRPRETLRTAPEVYRARTMQRRHFGTVILVWVVLVGGGCSSSQMSRIDRNRDLYERWPLEIRQAVLDGKVEPGMDPDMVRVAWGEPSEVSISPAGDEIWIYSRGGSQGSVIYPGGVGNTGIGGIGGTGGTIGVSTGRGGTVLGGGGGIGVGGGMGGGTIGGMGGLGTGGIGGPTPIVTPPTPPEIREVVFRKGVVVRADKP